MVISDSSGDLFWKASVRSITVYVKGVAKQVGNLETCVTQHIELRSRLSKCYLVSLTYGTPQKRIKWKNKDYLRFRHFSDCTEYFIGLYTVTVYTVPVPIPWMPLPYMAVKIWPYSAVYRCIGPFIFSYLIKSPHRVYGFISVDTRLGR